MPASSSALVSAFSIPVSASLAAPFIPFPSPSNIKSLADLNLIPVFATSATLSTAFTALAASVTLSNAFTPFATSLAASTPFATSAVVPTALVARLVPPLTGINAKSNGSKSTSPAKPRTSEKSSLPFLSLIPACVSISLKLVSVSPLKLLHADAPASSPFCAAFIAPNNACCGLFNNSNTSNTKF